MILSILGSFMWLGTHGQYCQILARHARQKTVTGISASIYRIVSLTRTAPAPS